MGGAMSNPFEYREVMKAAMKFGETRTVEEVLAEHERRHDERRAKMEQQAALMRNARGKKGAPGTPRTPSKGQVDGLKAMFDRGQQLRAAKKS